LAIADIFFVFSLKSLRRPIWQIPIFENKIHLAATVFSLAVLLVALNMPALRTLFSLVEVGSAGVVFSLLLGIANLLTIELGKLYFITRKKV